MWSLEALNTLNTLAVELARQGKPEKLALTLFTDPRRNAEAQAVLESARRREEGDGCCEGRAAA